MKQSIKISRTAHYYLQTPDKPITSILYVLHGYAQLAKPFLEEFSVLKNTTSLVVAPEAISKFYNKERKAVANWMTSHERKDEIDDYVKYLNDLHQSISKQFGNLPASVLGFSQGVSTCMRWITKSSFVPLEIHLCSGSIPPEIKSKDTESLKASSLFYYYGTADGLLSTKKAEEQIVFLKTLELSPQSIQFEGRHEIHPVTLEQLLKTS